MTIFKQVQILPLKFNLSQNQSRKLHDESYFKRRLDQGLNSLFHWSVACG